MKLTGWALFINKIEIVACMIFGAHALKTGKHKKLAKIWLIFEVLINVATVIFSIVMLRIEEGSWGKGFKKASDSLDKEFGIVEDDSLYKELYERNLKEKCELFGKKCRRDRLIKKYAERNKSLAKEYETIDD